MAEIFVLSFFDQDRVFILFFLFESVFFFLSSLILLFSWSKACQHLQVFRLVYLLFCQLTRFFGLGRAQTPTARSDKYKSRLIWTGNQIEKFKKHQLYFFLFHSCQLIFYIFIHFSCYVFDNIFILRFSNIFLLITEVLLGYLVVFVILDKKK